MKSEERKPWQEVKSGYITSFRIGKSKFVEGGPTCRRCAAAGRPCYSHAPLRTLGLRLSDNFQEARGFHLFTSQIGNDLAVAATESFWTSFVPQLGHAFPAIRHAVMSLSTLCEDIEAASSNSDPDPGTSAQRRAFALNQSNKACSLLIAPAEELPVVVLLVCCILFVYQQHAFGDYITALKHIRSGLKIWQSWQSRSKPFKQRSSAVIIDDHVAPVLSNMAYHYDLHFSNSFRTSMEQQSLFKCGDFGNSWEIISISDAQNTLRSVVASVHSSYGAQKHGFGYAEIVHASGMVATSRILRLWFEEFTRFLQRSKSNLDDPRLCALRIQHKLCDLMINTAPYNYETIFDSHTSSFRSIVQDARTIIQSDRIRNAKQCQKILGSDFKLIMPLFSVIMYCRDPRVRRDAISLLRLYNRQEGSWSSHVVADVGEKFVQIEDENTAALDQVIQDCSDVGEDCRIKLVRAEAHDIPTSQDSDVLGTIKLFYLRYPYDPERRIIYETSILWRWHQTFLVLKFSNAEMPDSLSVPPWEILTKADCGCWTRFFPIS